MPKPSDKPAIEFRDVVKKYHLMHRRGMGFKYALLHLPSYIREWRASGSFTSLDNVSFDVQQGESFGVCGRNGSGKSTTLGLIAGILRATSGTVKVHGRVCPLLELGAGFHMELSGRENVYLNAIILGMRRREIEERFDRIIEFSGLEKFIDEPIRTYSSGMLMRLGFSVAVHTDPAVLLVDEVLAVGDQEFQAKCLKKMKEFRESGVTIVLVTHDYEQVHKMCDRVLLLDGGRVICQGTPSEVETAYLNLARKKSPTEESA